MKIKDKILFTLVILLAFGWIIYLVKSVLTPFIFSLIAAYLLNPLVNYLVNKFRFSRLAATALIIGLFFGILTLVVLTLFPIIYSQLAALIDILPTYFQTIVDEIYPMFMAKLQHFGVVLHTDLTQIIDEEKINSHLISFSQEIFTNALSSSLTLINLVSLVFITPVLIFYLLKDWDIFCAKLRSYLPRSVSNPIEDLMRDMDKTLSGYIRGQINVCLILAIAYGTALNFTGLNFGFLIGLLTGLFAFIPYVAMICGISIAIIIGLFQWGFDVGHISIVALVFISINLIESNFLVPKLIGEKVGLHPVWVIFGLFFFGTLFGFVGVLLALPLSAISGVIIRFCARSYKKRYT
jgi:predicted PurR-regulated permease PerM